MAIHSFEICMGWLMVALGKEEHGWEQEQLSVTILQTTGSKIHFCGMSSLSVAEWGQPCQNGAPELSICKEVLLLMMLKRCPDAVLVLYFQAAAKPTGKPYCTDKASHLLYKFVCNA